MKTPPSATPLPTLSATGPTKILLTDNQVNLAGPKPVSYVRQRTVAQERAGLEQVSTIRVTFNPHFETLALHELAVFRDGKRVDRLKTAHIDLAQRERRIEEGVYDEDIEAIIALTDIRVGDQVEYAYSVTGDNPVFGGKYSRIFALARELPVGKLSIRIQYPASRKLQYKLYQSNQPVLETVEGGIRTLSLNAETLPAVRLEQGTPSWHPMFPWLQVSEYESWDAVNSWARALYSPPTDLSPEFDAVLNKLKSEATSQRDLLAKTLTWVQNEIRYYSVAVGTSSHRPNHPNLTIRQRFGDCKDKSVLLSAMLRKLGIEAEPALVSTVLRKGLADWLPTPMFFDHVIVRARLGEETFWLDGTATYQGSALETLGVFPFSKALLAASPSHELTPVHPETQRRDGAQVVETFKITKYGAPVALIVEEKYFGSRAENFRRTLAAEGLRRVVERQQADYGKDFPNIEVSGEATVADDSAGNVISVTQAYNVPRLFDYERGTAPMSSVYARSVVPWFRIPGIPDRRFPLELAFPASFDHSIVIEMPNKLTSPIPAPVTWQDSYIAISNRITLDGTRLSFNYGAKTLRDHVPANDFPSFSGNLKQKGWPILFSSLQAPVIDRDRYRARLVQDLEKSGTNLRDPDQVDNYYQQFLKDYAVADEAIRGELLDGVLLAKAHRDRAEAASSLGRREQALADIAKSIAIDPTDAAHVLKAEVHLYSGQYREALDSLKHVKSEGSQTNTAMASGMTNFYLGNYQDAQRTFLQAAETAGPYDLPYALLWLAVTTRKMNQEPAGLLKKYLDSLPNSWPAEAISLVLGKSETAKVIAAAKENKKESRSRLCEAFFYLGQKALLDGKISDAKQWFSKSVDTNVVMYREHTFSQHELKRLGQN
ncbi:MAG: DUF3857 domain-containing protein [Rhodocyclales bacterium]|nr:DUF3857 domain-containing protein [Rhodocyclales bacterium]